MPLVIEEMLTSIEIRDEALVRRLIREELTRSRREETACERPRSERQGQPHDQGERGQE